MTMDPSKMNLIDKRKLREQTMEQGKKKIFRLFRRNREARRNVYNAMRYDSSDEEEASKSPGLRNLS